MQALQRPARNGLLWLRAGFGLVRRRPAAMMAIVAAYWFVILTVSSLPYLGSLIASLLIPPLSVGVMNACRRNEAGELPRIDALISAFRGNPGQLKSLIALGALYLAATLSVLFLTSLVDDGILMGLMTGRPVTSEELLAPAFERAAQLALVLMAPIMMAWWYAPLLVSWHGVPLVKALFFSLVACWRNWRAFTVYGLVSAGLGLPFLSLVALLLLSSGLPQTASIQILFMVAILLLGPIYFASFYFTWRDVFAESVSSTDAGHVDTEA